MHTAVPNFVCEARDLNSGNCAYSANIPVTSASMFSASASSPLESSWFYQVWLSSSFSHIPYCHPPDHFFTGLIHLYSPDLQVPSIPSSTEQNHWRFGNLFLTLFLSCSGRERHRQDSFSPCRSSPSDIIHVSEETTATDSNGPSATCQHSCDTQFHFPL